MSTTATARPRSRGRNPLRRKPRPQTKPGTPNAATKPRVERRGIPRKLVVLSIAVPLALWAGLLWGWWVALIILVILLLLAAVFFKIYGGKAWDRTRQPETKQSRLGLHDPNRRGSSANRGSRGNASSRRGPRSLARWPGHRAPQSATRGGTTSRRTSGGARGAVSRRSSIPISHGRGSTSTGSSQRKLFGRTSGGRRSLFGGGHGRPGGGGSGSGRRGLFGGRGRSEGAGGSSSRGRGVAGRSRGHGGRGGLFGGRNSHSGRGPLGGRGSRGGSAGRSQSGLLGRSGAATGHSGSTSGRRGLFGRGSSSHGASGRRGLFSGGTRSNPGASRPAGRGRPWGRGTRPGTPASGRPNGRGWQPNGRQPRTQRGHGSQPKPGAGWSRAPRVPVQWKRTVAPGMKRPAVQPAASTARPGGATGQGPGSRGGSVGGTTRPRTTRSPGVRPGSPHGKPFTSPSGGRPWPSSRPVAGQPRSARPSGGRTLFGSTAGWTGTRLPWQRQPSQPAPGGSQPTAGGGRFGPLGNPRVLPSGRWAYEPARLTLVKGDKPGRFRFVRTAPRPFRDRGGVFKRPAGWRRPNRGGATIIPLPISGGTAMPATRGRVRVHGSPWQGVRDAALSAAKQFQDPVAMEGMQAAATAHLALQAIGEALNKVGQTTDDTVRIDPRVQEYMRQLGQYVMKAVQPTADAGAAIWRAHQEKISRIEENDPKERPWDVGAHDGMHTGRRRVGRRRAV